MSAPLLVRGAELVWTGTRELAGADVLCADGHVVAVGPDLAAPEGSTVLDARGCAVIPGLVNAHHHLLQSAFRTLPGTRGVPMRAWLGVMAAAYRAAVVDPELCGAAAAVGLAEGLLAGVTTVADHHLTWPPGADHVGMALATAEAARSLGARLVFVRGTAGDDADEAAAHLEALVGALDAGVQLAVGPAGVHSDGPETFAALRAVALRHGLARRTQAHEQVDVAVAAERYGRTPLELLDEWGWLEPGVTVAHLCEIGPADVARVERSGVAATHAPGCDLPMGWGLMPAGALLDAGVAVGLGTSGGGSNDAGHLLADARLALQVSPLAPRPATGGGGAGGSAARATGGVPDAGRPTPGAAGGTAGTRGAAQATGGAPDARETAPAHDGPSTGGGGLTAREVLTMATAGSAAGLGRPELGHLEPGAAADLCVYDLTGAADAGVADPLAGLLWAAPGRRPRDVAVAGRLAVRDHALTRADERSLAEALRVRLKAVPR